MGEQLFGAVVGSFSVQTVNYKSYWLRFIESGRDRTFTFQTDWPKYYNHPFFFLGTQEKSYFFFHPIPQSFDYLWFFVMPKKQMNTKIYKKKVLPDLGLFLKTFCHRRKNGDKQNNNLRSMGYNKHDVLIKAIIVW